MRLSFLSTSLSSRLVTLDPLTGSILQGGAPAALASVSVRPARLLSARKQREPPSGCEGPIDRAPRREPPGVSPGWNADEEDGRVGAESSQNSSPASAFHELGEREEEAAVR